MFIHIHGINEHGISHLSSKMSKVHIQQLKRIIPDLADRHILDIGSGKGQFLIAAAQLGMNAEGVELCEDYIDQTYKAAEQHGVTVRVTQGEGERLPFSDETFDFLNLSEVIEHVEDPDMLLQEMYRVLKSGGKVYISVPNRYSWFDTHYHIPFINWMPRSVAQRVLTLLGKNKTEDKNNGKQRLDTMYYATPAGFSKKARQVGFKVSDLRLLKLRDSYFKKCVYLVARPVYFRALHFLLEK